MTEQQSDYRKIIKATSIFGGVQVFKVLIQVVRSKIIAVLLGPIGIGIFGLLNSTISFISGITGLGLGTSAVKNVAEAYGSGDKLRIALIVNVLKKCVWVTGLLGAIVTIILAPWLSEITFGHKEYTLAFQWLSITLIFNQLSSGQFAILQGLRKINYLAIANLTGAFLGLVVSVPIYYMFGIDGIVPAIIVTSFLSLLRSWYFTRKVQIVKIKVPRQTTILEGKGMMKMGFMINLGGLLAVGTGYLTRIFVSNNGGIEQVGLYNAGFMIINTYVGMIFTAMTTDYYPRLSSVAQDNIKSQCVINQQAEITILILAPILAVFLIYINWVVLILYSIKFIKINEMIHWAAIGMFFKAASYPIAFLLLAKGASNLFLFNESLVNIYILIFNILGYKYFGLTGLGVSFVLVYLIYLIQLLLLSNIKFNFTLSREFRKVFIIQLSFVIGCFIGVKLFNKTTSYIVGSILITLSVVYSLFELNKRIELLKLIRKFGKC